MSVKSNDVTNKLTARLEAMENEASPAADFGGAGTLVINGSSNLLLSGNNSYSGSTTISAGQLTPSNIVTTIASGVRLAIQRNQLGLGNVSGSLIIQAGGTVVVQDPSGDVFYTGPLTTSFEALRNADPATGVGDTFDAAAPAAVQAAATEPAEEKKSSYRA